MIDSQTQSLRLDSKSGGLRPLRVRVPLPALLFQRFSTFGAAPGP